jgi:hypothetical protein
MRDNMQEMTIILCQNNDQSLSANTEHSHGTICQCYLETAKFQDSDTQSECRIKPAEIYCGMLAHSPELAL